MLAVQADGHKVETVEGLASASELHPIQEGFKQEHALAVWLLYSRNDDGGKGSSRKRISIQQKMKFVGHSLEICAVALVTKISSRQSFGLLKKCARNSTRSGSRT